MDLSTVQKKMEDAVAHLRGELAQIRTGRANASLVSDIAVDAYNTKMVVKELAQITAPEPTVLLISPWDKSIITNIIGGISKANIGLNAVADRDLVRIVIPPLTSERREEFIKQMHGLLEKYKVEIRQIRHETREAIKEEKDEDEVKRLEEQLQKLHDEYVEAIEVAGEAKEAELRQV